MASGIRLLVFALLAGLVGLSLGTYAYAYFTARRWSCVGSKWGSLGWALTTPFPQIIMGPPAGIRGREIVDALDIIKNDPTTSDMRVYVMKEGRGGRDSPRDPSATILFVNSAGVVSACGTGGRAMPSAGILRSYDNIAEDFDGTFDL